MLKDNLNITKRIIPCLDIKDGKVVKGVNFLGLKEVGSVPEIAKKYNDSGADELVFLDISATNEKRKTTDIIKEIAKNIFIPLTVGGGISTIEDISNLLNVGCDKVSLNSSALNNPNLIKEAANTFGSQCIVVAVDIKKRKNGSIGVFTHGGSKDSGKDFIEWIKIAQDLGAGEILLTSMDTDGTKSGFDIKNLKIADEILNIPLIASGGAGKKEDFLELFQAGIGAGLAASVFHYGEIKIEELKQYLSQNNIKVRI